MVIHSEDGLDEISLAADTHVAELRQGEISEYTLRPEELGIERESLQDLVVDGVDESLQLLTAALAGDGDGRSQRAAHLVALNAGAALYVAGVADSVNQGVALANEKLASGEALEKLHELAAMTQTFD
jgi:anthranilate phosphoribosyltransferase